jgi:alkylation response protein AidB-like acyl-CoA dehydrogenase
MNFALTDEQEMLRKEVRRYLAERYPETHEWDPSEWSELGKLGWTGISVPEAEGGNGLGLLDEAVVFEECGRARYPGPFVTSVGLALPALDPGRRARLAAGEATFSVSFDGIAAPDRDLVDEVITITDPGTAERVRRRGFCVLALESVGIAQRALEIGVEHARSREQFGRRIGVYQAVSHKLADTFVETELARSLAYWAAWCETNATDDALIAAASAKAYAADAAVAACERSIQVLGGIGMTWEHVVHRYYKRALSIQAFGGPAQRQRALVAQALFD